MVYQPAIYILTNKKNGTLYVGVTTNLKQRIWQHKNKITLGFSSKYNLNILVYFELHENINSAILREKRLKKWRRQWKIKLINQQNSDWHDLWEQIIL